MREQGTSLNDADLWGCTVRIPWESIIDEDLPEAFWYPGLHECIEMCDGDRIKGKALYWKYVNRSKSRHNYVRCFERTGKASPDPDAT